MFPRCGCIVAYTAAEHVSVTAQLAELNLQAREDTIMIEARTIGLHVSRKAMWVARWPAEGKWDFVIVRLAKPVGDRATAPDLAAP